MTNVSRRAELHELFRDFGTYIQRLRDFPASRISWTEIKRVLSCRYRARARERLTRSRVQSIIFPPYNTYIAVLRHSPFLIAFIFHLHIFPLRNAITVVFKTHAQNKKGGKREREKERESGVLNIYANESLELKKRLPSEIPLFTDYMKTRGKSPL